MLGGWRAEGGALRCIEGAEGREMGGGLHGRGSRRAGGR